jgi:hypothetical protein
MRGAFFSTALALARFPFDCALLERIDHGAPGDESAMNSA